MWLKQILKLLVIVGSVAFSHATSVGAQVNDSHFSKTVLNPQCHFIYRNSFTKDPSVSRSSFVSTEPHNLIESEALKKRNNQLDDPLDLQTYLAKRNLQLELISAKIENIKSTTVFILLYESKPVLQIQFEVQRSKQSVVPNTQSITNPSGKKGLGTVAYLVLARYLFLQHSKILSSDAVSLFVSDSAQDLWSRFQQLGLADYNYSYYFFKKQILQDSELWEQVDQIPVIPEKKSFWKLF